MYCLFSDGNVWHEELPYKTRPCDITKGARLVSVYDDAYCKTKEYKKGSYYFTLRYIY